MVACRVLFTPPCANVYASFQESLNAFAVTRLIFNSPLRVQNSHRFMDVTELIFILLAGFYASSFI